MSDVCRSCGKPIIWCKTKAGKNMPVDAEPSEAGTVLVKGDKCEVVKKTDLLPGMVLHTSHFSTCPHSSQHRKPKT